MKPALGASIPVSYLQGCPRARIVQGLAGKNTAA